MGWFPAQLGRSWKPAPETAEEGRETGQACRLLAVLTCSAIMETVPLRELARLEAWVRKSFTISWVSFVGGHKGGSTWDPSPVKGLVGLHKDYTKLFPQHHNQVGFILYQVQYLK